MIPARWRPQILRCYRGLVLVGVVVLIHWQTAWLKEQRPSTFSFIQAQQFLPRANRIRLVDEKERIHHVDDAAEEKIGLLLTTSPFTDDIIGYSGPNDILVALDESGAVAGVGLLSSGDTEEHVQLVKDDPGFFESFMGWQPSDPAPVVEAVSGATLTSYAIAEGIQRRLGGSTPSLRFPEAVTVQEVKRLMPEAAGIEQERRRFRVVDAMGNLIGFVVRTSPEADNQSGYRGPTELLVALDTEGRTVVGLEVRKSYDTRSYVDQVVDDEFYLPSFVGRTLDELATLDYEKEEIEGVSGATDTSFAIVEGLKRRAASAGNPVVERPWFKGHDWALVAVLAGALLMTFSSLRGYRVVRVMWQAVLIGYVGFISGDLLSLDLLHGWAAEGAAWRMAPGLVLLAGAAFVLPWVTRRQVYCHQICPHGALQQWVGALGRRILNRSDGRLLPVGAGGTQLSDEAPRRGSGVGKYLGWLPWLLLGAALVLVLFGISGPLISMEPFDAWVWQAAGAVTIGVAVVGLVASFFVPQAYCRYGCPTGALLGFVRYVGAADRWGRRDQCALLLLVVGGLAVVGARATFAPLENSDVAVMSGETMGTTWSVKVRGETIDFRKLEHALSNELAWAEETTSHWRTNNDVAKFNRSDSTNAISMPWPVMSLVRKAGQISEETGGAFDVTVGPLVRLWGFGPGPSRDTPPAESEIAAVASGVGWGKVEVASRGLKKSDVKAEIDLSGIAKGWAVDQLFELMERRGFTNYLVEVGGELRAEENWLIEVEHPSQETEIRSEAIATSGTYLQHWGKGEVPYSHLIDPRTGRPVIHDTVAVSVRDSECWKADGWATALNVMGMESGLPLAERLGLAVRFVRREADGELTVKVTSAWK